MAEQQQYSDIITFSGTDVTVYAMIRENELMNISEDPTLITNGEIFTLPEDAARDISGMNNIFTLESTSGTQIKQNANNLQSNNDRILHLKNLQTISYSVYRGMDMAKGLGSPLAKGHNAGYVTIAGTMVFTVLNKAVLSELFPFITKDTLDKNGYGVRLDMLPAFDLLIIFSNESGFTSYMSILGVKLMNEGQVMSVQDLMTESSLNYMARDYTRMKPMGTSTPQELSARMISNSALLDWTGAKNAYIQLRSK